MRFTWLDSKALILKSRKELITSFVAAAVVTAVGFAISSAALASAQDLSRRSSAAEAAFLKENDAAMTKMMDDMAVKPTGDVDRDFVAMMVPHHEGGIDMARAELRYGSEPQLRRIAQEIVVDQIQADFPNAACPGRTVAAVRLVAYGSDAPARRWTGTLRPARHTDQLS